MVPFSVNFSDFNFEYYLDCFDILLDVRKACFYNLHSSDLAFSFFASVVLISRWEVDVTFLFRVVYVVYVDNRHDLCSQFCAVKVCYLR